MFESNHEVKIVKYGYRVLCTQAEHLVQGGDDGVIVYEMKVEPSCQYRRLWTFEVCCRYDQEIWRFLAFRFLLSL